VTTVLAVSRRELLKAGASGIAATLLSPILVRQALAAEARFDPLPPISVQERKARVAKAQTLIRKLGLGALLLEPGSSMLYFTGIDWWRSERLTAVVIPADGEIGVVTPYFEEPSVRETLAFGDDVRTWNEDENPLQLVRGILADRGTLERPLAVEQTVRYFVVSELRKLDSSIRTVSGAPVVLGCRMYKSDHELQLMQRAADITVASLRATYPQIAAGMAPDDIAGIMQSETARLGGEPEFNLILLGEASAYPHGSKKPQLVTKGGVVLMDCGCSYQGYQSDISRTFVYGEPTPKQRKLWDTVHRGQQLGFETAKPGTPAGHVDDTVRAYYESLGYGPGYKVPGTPHRLGHGIGMDGHEQVNLVGGETTPLASGMCFSDEPGIYIPGEFGVRLEDCFHMTDKGPRWFSKPPPSIDDPFG
jgi:Xaa-Pro aminopeptidase